MGRDRKEKEDLRINELIRENKNLKKKLEKMRKDISKTPESLPDLDVKKDSAKKCDLCCGEIKRFKIQSILLDICQRCKSRKRVTEEKETA